MEKGRGKGTDTLQTDNGFTRKEYIEREAALKRFSFATLDCLGMEPTIMAADVVKALKAIPAADVVPVWHGRWVPTSDANKKRCSQCDVITLIAQYPHGEINYCPNCGADMREVEHET